MSVLIKGMEMPKNCPCELVGIGYDMYCSFVHGIPARAREYDECCEKKTRPDWCPLIEVPEPHGRLIDEQEINSRFDNGIKTISELPLPNDFVELYKQLATEVKEEIGKCRTVIPASEEGE